MHQFSFFCLELKRVVLAWSHKDPPQGPLPAGHMSPLWGDAQETEQMFSAVSELIYR